MNKKAITFIKNFSYTLLSNLISILISASVVFIIPKLIGVEEFGYWQLYLFYSSYVGFLHFGWNDGIYLRYGGEQYKELDKKMFFSQFIMLLSLQIILSILIFMISYLLIDDLNKAFVLKMTALCMVVVNVRYMFLYILQSTNRIKEFAIITITEKILYLILIIFLLFAGMYKYEVLISVDLASKLISLFYVMFLCKEIVFQKWNNFYFSYKEMWENITVGIKLMFANISGILIIGVVRFGIERTWGVITFGKISLILTISNFMMIFVNALGIILYPLLRRTNYNNLPDIYTTMRDFLMIILFGILIIYYPIQSLLSNWLPDYSDSLIYMAFLFPMIIYEGKTALLINTYLKTLRKEKAMLFINLLTLFISIVTTYAINEILNNLNFAVASIVFLLAIKSIISEIYLSKLLSIDIKKDLSYELILSVLFIYISFTFESVIMMLYYGVFYLLYLLAKYKDIRIMIVRIRELIIK